MSAQSFSQIGISRITFKQDDTDGDGQFNVQGNDVSGTATITTDTGNSYEINGSHNMERQTRQQLQIIRAHFGGKWLRRKRFCRHIVQPRNNNTQPGKHNRVDDWKGKDAITVPGDTNISLLALDIEDPYTPGQDISGNASGVVENLNNYLEEAFKYPQSAGTASPKEMNLFSQSTLTERQLRERIIYIQSVAMEHKI